MPWPSAPQDSPPPLPSTAWNRTAKDPAGGPIVVTGASGGVGSVAIDMLAARGYKVIALSGKADATEYLEDLGATEVLDPQGTGLRHRVRSRPPATAAPSIT